MYYQRHISTACRKPRVGIAAFLSFVARKLSLFRTCQFHCHLHPGCEIVMVKTKQYAHRFCCPVGHCLKISCLHSLDPKSFTYLRTTKLVDVSTTARKRYIIFAFWKQNTFAHWSTKQSFSLSALPSSGHTQGTALPRLERQYTDYAKSFRLRCMGLLIRFTFPEQSKRVVYIKPRLRFTVKPFFYYCFAR